MLNYTEKEWNDNSLEFFRLKYKMVNKLKVAELHTSWEQARLIAFSAASAYLPKGTKMTDYLRFEWERPQKMKYDAEWVEKMRKFAAMGTVKIKPN